MNISNKKSFMAAISSLVLSSIVYAILLYHNAWGDDRYVLKEEARVAAIVEIDAQLAIKDTEILFAESTKEKEKLEAIKAIYKRQKEALKEKPKI